MFLVHGNGRARRHDGVVEARTQVIDLTLDSFGGDIKLPGGSLHETNPMKQVEMAADGGRRSPQSIGYFRARGRSVSDQEPDDLASRFIHQDVRH
ncbi:hypothetical protein GCM10017710_08650 [Arthrobacter ramosus]